jgi:hypothetical protein
MDPDPDPAIFAIDLQDANKKICKKLFLLFRLKGTFTSFFKEKNKRNHKTVGIKVFS